MGNIINRVFDSSGPEGKVRGTPQQIIEKYNQLARDAQLSNDRVATENFQQHAEHYMRMLSVAQREIDMRREEQERQNRDRQISESNRDNNRDRAPRPPRDGNDNSPAPADQMAENPVIDAGAGEQPDVMVFDVVEDSGLVETPEARAEVAPKAPPAPRKPRAPRKPAAERPATDRPEPKAAKPRDEDANPAQVDNAAE